MGQRFSFSAKNVFWRAALAALFGQILAVSAHAQTWDGGGAAGGMTLWSLATNWNPDGLPVNNGTAAIIMAGTIDTTNFVDVSFDISSLTFNNTAGAFTINNMGGATLTTRSGGITNNDSQNQTLNLPVILNGSQTWNATSGDLTFSTGQVNLGVSPLTLTLAGNNDYIFSGQVTGPGGSIVKNGNGEVQLTGLSGNSFGGSFTLNAGTLGIGHDSALANPSTLVINGGTIQALGSAHTVARPVTIGGDFAFAGSLGITLSGATTLTGDRTVTTGNSVSATLSGAIGQDVAGRSLSKVGNGTLTLSGSASNTYTGTTSVSAGTLVLGKTAGVNAVGGSFLSVGDGTGGANADVVRLAASNQILDTTAVIVHTSGLLDLNGFSETLSQLQIFGGNVTTGAGTLTVTSQVFHESGFNLTSTMTGNLNLGGGNVQFTIEDGTPGTDLNVSAVISNGSITKTLPGLLAFSGSAANTYTGTTTVNAGNLILNKSSGVLALAGDLVINNPLSTVLGSAPGQISAATDVTITNQGLLSLNANQTIGSLSLNEGEVLNNATLTVSGPVMVSNSGALSSSIGGFGGTLALTGSGTSWSVADGAAANDLEVDIAISSSSGFTKTGAGQLTFFGSDANSISGTTSISEGTLVLARSSGTTALSGNIVVGDGVGGANTDVLRVAADNQISQLVTETVTVNSSGRFELTGFSDAIGNLQLNAGSVFGGTIGFTGTVTSSAQSTSSTIQSTVDLLASTTLFNVADGIAGDDLAIVAAVTNGTFTKTGAGTLKLAGGTANTATLSQLTAGTVILEKTAGVSALGGLTVVISDGAGPAQGDILRYGVNNDQLPDTFEVQVQSAGLFDLNGRSDTIGTLTMNGSGVVHTGAGTLTVASQVLSSLNTTAGTINGNLNLGGGVRSFSIADSVIPAIDLTVTAAMSNGTLLKQGAGTLALTGAALSSAISYQLDDGTLSAGPLTVSSAQAFTQNAGVFSGSLNNHGTFIYNGGAFTGQLVNKSTGATTFNANFTAGNGLTNEGTITIASGRVVTASGIGLTNDGTIAMDGGTLAAASTFNFINNELITGHGVISASSVNFVNAGDIVVSGGDLAINSNFSPINNSIIFVPNNLKLQLLGTGNMQNNGLILLDGGKITGPAGVSNLLGGEIRGGSSVETPLTNAGGLIHATGPGTLTINALTGNTAGGELRVDDGATLNAIGSFASSGTIVLAGANATLSGGTITNTGTLRGLGRVNNVVANTGTIRAENGTLTLAAAGHTNAAAGRIESGLGTQVLYSQGLATNSGQIALTGGAFDNNNVAMANPGFIGGYGTLRTGGLTNSGTISVGGSLDVLGAVTQNATVSTQTGTTVRFFGPVSGPGSYPGTGTVMFLNTFSPGASPAEVFFGGNVIFTGTSNLIMELAGTTPGTEYDTITAAGTVGLGGTLDVDLLGGFIPDPGDTFQLINAAGGISGTFANVLLPTLANANWHLQYTPTSVLLQVLLKGDYNFDGAVNAADYIVWRKTFGQSAPNLPADGNANQQIDPGDYDVWQTNFGSSNGPGAAAGMSSNSDAGVPEPASAALVFLGLCTLQISRRRWSSAL